MKKSTKVWLIVAAALVFLGTVLFTATLFFGHWDFSKIGTAKYETNTYTVAEEFWDISIDTDTADIKLLPSQDGSCKIECFEEEKAKHEVKVENGSLVINKKSEKAWYDFINLGFSSPKITVYLPKNEFNTIYIKESTGDVDIEKLSAISLDITLSTGDVYLSDVTCKNFATNGNTGDVCLKNLSVAKKLWVTRSTGDIEFVDSDAFEIFVKTDTGDVEGSLLSSKNFITESDTGRVLVPKSTEGGLCEIATDTGDIKIEVKDGI